jgi:signal transduction histidine kinase
VSIQRALLLLIAFVLVAALVPAGLLLQRRLSGTMESRARQELASAPSLLAESQRQTSDAMMMHAKEIATTSGLAQALMSGADSLAVQLVESARGGYGEQAVLVSADGRMLAGSAPPGAMLDRARRGEMPVDVVADSAGLRTVALAPVHMGDSLAGIAGVVVGLGETAAQAFAGLTRAEILILDERGAIAASTLAPADTGEVAAAARSSVAGDATIRAVSADGRLLLLTMDLGEHTTAALVRDLDRDRAIIAPLGRLAVVSVALAAVFALLLGSGFAMRLAGPVRSLASAADRLAAGDFHAPIERPRITELGRMADAFEAMRRSLEARLDELARANRELADRQQRLSALQAELIQRDRLAAAGQLVAQLAHEIRNPVANVRNCLEIIRRRLPADTEAREFADLAIDELLRMHELAEQMLDLHRPRDPGVHESDPAAILGEVASLVRLGAPDTLEILIDAPANGRAVIAPDALKQVMLNLVQNAREALRDRGRIDVHVHREGGSVVIDVSDTGPGIPADVLPHVFDPFFTTKGSVHGVGLGLFVAEGIVRGVGGRITAANRTEGHGARFSVALPIAVAAEASA